MYCRSCVMPSTRPGIKFNEEGVCNPCANAKRKKKVDWDKRQEELAKLCDTYRSGDGSYDCLIAVSGGKDSHYQVSVMKEEMGMNPLLINVWNYSWTNTGIQNWNNIQNHFGCDAISLHLNHKVARAMTRKAFEKHGSPTWYWDRAVYAFPPQMALNLKIPLLVYGENISYEYGGEEEEETPSARAQLSNGVVKDISLYDWIDEDIRITDLQNCLAPTKEQMEKIEPIYLSYFKEWSGFKNMVKAKDMGFKSLSQTNEWRREGFIDDYDQIDSAGYLVHPWLKYPKFGHARVTDVASGLIRDGLMTRKYAIEQVKLHDHKLDPFALKDFLAFTGYTDQEFWHIVDKFYNRDIFNKTETGWELKEPIWKESSL